MKKNTIVICTIVVILTACAVPTPAALSGRIETGIDPQTWAAVPGGAFLYGAHNEAAFIDGDYEMMITDVTNAQFAGYLNEALAAGKIKINGQQVVGYYPGDVFHHIKHEKEIQAGDWLHMPVNSPDSRLQFDGKIFTPQPGYENHPVVMVSWFGAEGYCEYYGWRLPTEKEWEKGARGTEGLTYPWGDTISPQNANYYASRDPFETGTGKLGTTSPAGFYNGKTYSGYETINSASPYGLYDMAGNVWQWTADIYEGAHYRYLRGGSRADYSYNLRVWTRNSAGPDYTSPSVGFRCARD